ncbi:MAG TPA: DUF4349 domain-containing protein [Solirubrobacteraceae bacterium]|jgi:hypothetical protein
MSRHENTQMSAEMERELEALDAALAGESVPSAQAALADFARGVRSLRARAQADFVEGLDARAASGFARRDAPRRPASSPRRRAQIPLRWRQRPSGGPRHRAILLLPAAGLALAVVVLAISLSGQGRGSTRAPHAASVPVQAGPAAAIATAPAKGQAVPAPSGESSGAGGTGGAAPARQVERTSTLDIGVAPGSMRSASQRVFTLASAFGGYVRQSSVSSGPVGPGGASFDVRVPSSNLSAAIAGLSHLGHVRSESDTTNDVTTQLDSMQRSLTGLQAERAGLLRQLAAASEPQLAAALKARLRAVEGGISRLKDALSGLRSRVSYTSLALSLTPEASAGATTGDLTPGGAARDAGQILEAALAVLVIGAAAVLPLGLVVMAGWIAVALTRRRLREQALDAST